MKTQVLGKTKERKIQIWGETKKMRKKIKKFVGKKVKVKGRLDAHGSLKASDYYNHDAFFVQKIGKEKLKHMIYTLIINMNYNI